MNENFRFSDLLDLSAIQTMADSLYRATGMPIGILDAIDGSVLVGTGWHDICDKFHRANPSSLRRCLESEDYIKARLVEGEAYRYKCMNGLWDMAIPIMVKGRHLATMFLGQLFYEGEVPDREFFIRQAESFDFDLNGYLEALDRVPVFSRDKIDTILQYNKALVAFISSQAKNALSKFELNRALKLNEERFQLAQKAATSAFGTGTSGRGNYIFPGRSKRCSACPKENSGRPTRRFWHVSTPTTGGKSLSRYRPVSNRGAITTSSTGSCGRTRRFDGFRRPARFSATGRAVPTA